MTRRASPLCPVPGQSTENFVSGAPHTKVLQRKHSAARSRAGGNKALLTPEPMARLVVASLNVRGGFFPNIGSTGSDTGRYQGAIAVKAVPFPSVARRSQLSSHLSARTRPPRAMDCVACFVSNDSVIRNDLIRGLTTCDPRRQWRQQPTVHPGSAAAVATNPVCPMRPGHSPARLATLG
jgi:hypothetical protein